MRQWNCRNFFFYKNQLKLHILKIFMKKKLCETYIYWADIYSIKSPAQALMNTYLSRVVNTSVLGPPGWPWCYRDVYWFVYQFCSRKNSQSNYNFIPFRTFYGKKNDFLKPVTETISWPLTLPEADGLPDIDRTKLFFYDFFLLGLFTDHRKEVLFHL